ncbi:hypothetical protein ACFY93_30050 [Streptomyces sp. NPDC008313]|uniref:MGH1-like glycoside hydrolase domain-containing protein n=1 Tax=Streptomyces sp. NPDC008313 TaxID=3364826 RepID=UPI0036DFC073
MAVLEGNWTGASTVPSRSLYPHQWSWDSAFIAIGLRHLSPSRARTELETLFDAQWGDGRVPHIVFNPSVPLDAYFPSPDFWRSSTAGSAAGAPRSVQTSGIVQPPVHALAAWLVHRADPEGSRACGFLERLRPGLAAWHRYLLERRDLGGGGLVSVVHPWEQGMDNSPCWDAPLARVTPAPPHSFRRADLDHGAPGDRPTELDYGRYVRLAADYRDRGYADGPGEAAFAVEDPAFNALLIASEQALAGIEEELGACGASRRADADRLTTALVERLWAPAEGIFLCRDVGGAVGVRGGGLAGSASSAGSAGSVPESRWQRPSLGAAVVPGQRSESSALASEQRSPATDESSALALEHCSTPGDGESTALVTGRRPLASGDESTAHTSEHRSHPGRLIPQRSVSGLIPLLLPTLPGDISAALVRTACGPHFGVGGAARLVPSYDLTGDAFDPDRYWRGPSWFNTAWLVERGLRRHGERDRAAALREEFLKCAARTGFAEYVTPRTGEGRGARGFSWTAALTLDLLHEPDPSETGPSETDAPEPGAPESGAHGPGASGPGASGSGFAGSLPVPGQRG